MFHAVAFFGPNAVCLLALSLSRLGVCSAIIYFGLSMFAGALDKSCNLSAHRCHFFARQQKREFLHGQIFFNLNESRNCLGVLLFMREPF